MPFKSRHLRTPLNLVAALVFLLGCTGSSVTTYNSFCPTDSTDTQVTTYLLSHGWHVGLLLPTASLKELAGGSILELQSYPYVEVGWGDEDYYMGKELPLLGALQAGLFSGGSVLHIVGFNSLEEAESMALEAVTLKLSQTGIATIGERIRETLYTDSQGETVRLGSSLYGTGSFYKSNLPFSINYTCNSWVSDLLIAAGCKVSRTRFSGKLLNQLR